MKRIARIAVVVEVEVDVADAEAGLTPEELDATEWWTKPVNELDDYTVQYVELVNETN